MNTGPDNTEGIHSGEWVTPAGNAATMFYRGDSTDWNTISAITATSPIGPGGFEPPFSESKSDVLPLDEGPVRGR